MNLHARWPTTSSTSHAFTFELFQTPSEVPAQGQQLRPQERHPRHLVDCVAYDQRATQGRLSNALQLLHDPARRKDTRKVNLAFAIADARLKSPPPEHAADIPPQQQKPEAAPPQSQTPDFTTAPAARTAGKVILPRIPELPATKPLTSPRL